MSLHLLGVAPAAHEILPVCVMVDVLLAETLRVRVQLRKYRFQLVDVDIQHTLEELTANLREPPLQLWHNAPPLARRFDDQEPMIARIALACKKPARFQAVHEPRDLAFVAAHDRSELSGRCFTFLGTMQKNCRFLRRHSELAEAAIKRSLQPDARSKEARYG